MAIHEADTKNHELVDQNNDFQVSDDENIKRLMTEYQNKLGGKLMGFSKVSHKIKIPNETKLIYKRNYRLDSSKLEFVKNKVNEYLKKGIIEESVSP